MDNCNGNLVSVTGAQWLNYKEKIQNHGFGSHLLGLFDLQLREEVDEPLEGPLIPVDPEEVNLFGDKIHRFKKQSR